MTTADRGHELVDADLTVADAAAEPLRFRPIDGDVWHLQERNNGRAWLVGKPVPVEP